MSKEIKDGGPAFPKTALYQDNGDGSLNTHDDEPGMSLRDYFAAKALPIAWSAFQDGYYECETTELPREVSMCAYQMADAMLAAREGKA